MVIGLDHVQVAMPPGGEAAARDFYGNLLGMRELAKPVAVAKHGGAWFVCGALQFHLGVEQDFRPARKAHPAMRVDDLNELKQRLVKGGFSVIEDTQLEHVDRVFTEDPFGNRIELIQN